MKYTHFTLGYQKHGRTNSRYNDTYNKQNVKQMQYFLKLQFNVTNDIALPKNTVKWVKAAKINKFKENQTYFAETEIHVQSDLKNLKYNNYTNNTDLRLNSYGFQWKWVLPYNRLPNENENVQDFILCPCFQPRCDMGKTCQCYYIPNLNLKKAHYVVLPNIEISRRL